MKQMLWMAVVALTLSACQTIYVPQAREVKKKPKVNGIIALPNGFRTEDRAKADDIMKQNCSPMAVNVTDEGETVVGQETKGASSTTNRDDSRQSMGNLFGIPLVSGQAAGNEVQNSSVTKQITEWQVVYNCMASNDAPTKTKTKKQ
jgi:hypothetical protein